MWLLLRTDVSEELSTTIIRVTRIGEIGTAVTVTRTDASCEVLQKRRLLQNPQGENIPEDELLY
jgi:hypothetical protein